MVAAAWPHLRRCVAPYRVGFGSIVGRLRQRRSRLLLARELSIRQCCSVLGLLRLALSIAPSGVTALAVPALGAGEDTLPSVRINVISVFPEFFTSPLDVSLVGKALDAGTLVVNVVDLREYGKGVHRQVDDAPFGGGAGMVMGVEPMASALEPLGGTHKVLFSAAGMPLVQSMLDKWAAIDELTLVCGRYEGVDERVAEHLVDEEISIGDYVLLGGEVAALAVIEGVTRLLPGVVGNPDSIISESFRSGQLEEPQYTRPAEFRGWEVPKVLLSGDHARIAEWRTQQRFERTRNRRPDLAGDSPELAPRPERG